MKVKINKNIDVDIDLEPEDLASAFKKMDTKAKADFFNEVYGVYANKELLKLEMEAVNKSDYLDPDYGGLVIEHLVKSGEL